MTGCVGRQNCHLLMLGYSRVHDSDVTNLKFPPRHRSGWGETRAHVFRWVKGCSHQGCCDCLGHTWSLWRTRDNETFAAWDRACNLSSVPQPSCATTFLFPLPHLWMCIPTWTQGWRELILPYFMEKSAQSNKAILVLITARKKQVAEKVRVSISWDCTWHGRVMKD